MFSVHCPDHGCEVLLSESRIEALVPTAEGLQVQWVCWCGARGSFLTGREREGLVGPATRPAVSW